MEIGLFQLENLVHTRVEFKILDLRMETKSLPPALEALLTRGIRLSVENVETYLREGKTPLSAPVILLCDDGKASARIAETLESQGFQNVFVVGGGVEGLLSEL
jgi:rhodanese-related sulfurtransferase